MEKKGNTKMLAVLGGYKSVNSGFDPDNPPYKQYIYPIQINDGNYTTKSLLYHIKTLLLNCGIFSGQPTTLLIDQDPYTGRCVITISTNFLISNIVPPPNSPYSNDPPGQIDQTLSYQLSFVFHDPVKLNSKLNYNLGWILGFRTPILILFSEYTTVPITTPVVKYGYSLIDTAGTKYVILRLDDYKSNRLNKSLVCINTKLDQHIHMPSYYNTSISKFNTSKNTVNILPSAPNTLTAAQQYTINSISDSYLYNNNITTQRIQNPDDSDIFAKIPIKRVTEWGTFSTIDNTYTSVDNGPGKLIIEFSGPLQLNTRDYFGPVNMTSFAVSLYDDKGMILGLNGMDWSFTIIAKSIYQY